MDAFGVTIQIVLALCHDLLCILSKHIGYGCGEGVSFSSKPHQVLLCYGHYFDVMESVVVMWFGGRTVRQRVIFIPRCRRRNIRTERDGKIMVSALVF